MGKVSQRAAEAVKFRVEHLLAAKLTGHALETDTARWLGELDSGLADKLARLGLIARREGGAESGPLKAQNQAQQANAVNGRDSQELSVTQA